MTIAGAAGSSSLSLSAKVGTIDICFLGDIYFGEIFQEARARRGLPNYLKEYGHTYPLQQLLAFTHTADFSLGNLETVLSTTTQPSLKDERNGFTIGHPQCSARALREARINAVALGNNHIADFGGVGVNDTLNALESFGVAHFGAGRNVSEANCPLQITTQIGPISTKVVVFSAYKYVEEFDRKFQMYARGDRAGAASISSSFLNGIAKARADDPQAIIIAYPHWGRNYRWRIDPQTETADLLLSAGVNIIIGHGAHMLQEIELRQGRWVLYGLGNYFFGSDGAYQKRGIPPFGLATRLRLRAHGKRISPELLVYPILSDNQATSFQPRLVTKEEVTSVLSLLRGRCPDLQATNARVGIGHDGHGWHIWLGLH